MKNKESFIKKIKHGLKIAGITALIASSLASCTPIQSPYPTQDEIAYSSELLGCDTGYLMKQNGDFVRMKHNNGEPIYVCFDEAYSSELKEEATEALDYVFGIVGKINDKYHYQVVDKQTFDCKINKTKVYYTFGEHSVDYGTHHSISNAYTKNYYPWYNKYSDNPIYNYYEVNLWRGLSKEDAFSTFLHENLHMMGFNDVYMSGEYKTTVKHYGNTFMNGFMDYNRITPNDLACLISLYADDDCDLKEMQQKLKNYEQKFYNYYADFCKEKAQTTDSLTDENFEWACSITQINKDGTRSSADYKLHVENEQYILTIVDPLTKKVVGSAKGKASLQNGVMVLQNVELQNGLYTYSPDHCYEGGYIQDLAVLMKNGKMSLYDSRYDFTFNGTYNSLEDSVTRN